MPRTKRNSPGGLICHVLNRGVGKMTLFEDEGDYRALLRVLGETLRLAPMRIFAFCIMPNHWHFPLGPDGDDDLSAFMQRMTNTHFQRWLRHRGRVGQRHVHQGRYESFPVEQDDDYDQVLRYIERNALRAGLFERAEDGKWCRLSPWQSSEPDETWPLACPLPCSPGWTEHVNRPRTEAETAAIRQALHRGPPLGSPAWAGSTARRLGLESTLRPRDRTEKDRRANKSSLESSEYAIYAPVRLFRAAMHICDPAHLHGVHGVTGPHAASAARSGTGEHRRAARRSANFRRRPIRRPSPGRCPKCAWTACKNCARRWPTARTISTRGWN